MALDQHSEATACVEEAETSLQDSNLKGDRLKAKQRSLAKLKLDIETAKHKSASTTSDTKNGKSKALKQPSRQYVRNLLPKLESPHPRFPSFSDALKVLYEPGKIRSPIRGACDMMGVPQHQA